MNTKQKTLKQILNEATDTEGFKKLTVSVSDNEVTGWQKTMRLADSTLMAFFCSVILVAAVSIATQEKLTLVEAWRPVALLSFGMTGTIYRMQYGDKD